MKDSRTDSDLGRVIAIVSGKGGSGKTMLAVALAQGVALAGKTVILVDTDFATGGLSYYLTFREFTRARVGLLDIKGTRRPVLELATTGTERSADSLWKSKMRLIPIGDQRGFRDDSEFDFAAPLGDLLREASQFADLILVDCRGGIDRQSVTVCTLADEILMVVETDTTSIRASQHLTDVLSDAGLKSKIAGYALNKVMDDPTSLAKTASSLLGVQYMGAVPFDIEATRAYVQGRIPSPSALFSRHVFAMLPRLMRNVDQYELVRVLSPEEFGTVTLRSPEVRTGGIFVLAATLYASGVYVWLSYSQIWRFDIGHFDGLNYVDVGVVVAMNLLVLGALSDSIKQVLGRSFRTCTDFVKRAFGLKARSEWG